MKHADSEAPIPDDCIDCVHDDVTMGWCVEWQRGKFETLHCRKCCSTPSCWEKA